MLERFCFLKKQLIILIPDLIANQNKCKCNIKQISNEDWLVLEQLRDILNPLYIETLALEKNSSCVSQIIPSVKMLRTHYNKLLSSGNIHPFIVEGISIIIKSLDERFSKIEENPIYAKATILDPRYKKKFFLQENIMNAHIISLQKELEKIIEDNITNENKKSTNKEIQFKENEKIQIEKKIGGIWEDYEKENLIYTRKKCSEVDDYFQALNLELTSDPYEYWKNSKISGRYVYLPALAQIYLSAPPGSYYSERVFSLVGNIANEKRASLSRENLKKLAFLKVNSF